MVLTVNTQANECGISEPAKSLIYGGDQLQMRSAGKGIPRQESREQQHM